jgi:hypothetical protein
MLTRSREELLGMQYPSRSDYCGSIRNPQFAFRKKDPTTKTEKDLDASLVAGKAIERVQSNGMKELWSASGSFAIAFKYETPSPRKTWAIRCFYRSNFEVANHYKRVLTHLKNSSCQSYFVDFDFLEPGIRVQGNCYPILKMEWIEGDNIKKFIKTNLGKKNVLKSLGDRWLKLSNNLLEAKVAHGDLQHGNILIVERFGGLELKLIDYDSLYFLGDNADDNIKGLSDYQHPLRKSLKKRCLEIDFFSQLVIYISILALAEDRKLWDIYRLDEREGLLFSKTDFENPERADVFRALSQLPAPIADLANKLKKVCQIEEFKNIPSLVSFLSDDRPLILNKKVNSIDTNSLVDSILDLFKKPINIKKSEKEERVEQIVEEEKEGDRAIDIDLVQSEPQRVNPTSEKPLVWDPRSYKAAHTPNNSSEPKAKKKPEQSSTSKPSLQQIQEKIIARCKAARTKLIKTIPNAIERLKYKPQTWTTREVADKLERSANWCHNQRYQYPDKFKSGTHYYKDDEGVIQWTKSGIKQLKSLRSQKEADAIPSNLLPTKEVSLQLGISPESAIQIKTKYASELVEGHHYYTDKRKRYYWTPEGIKRLEQIISTSVEEISNLKTKSSSKKKR